MLTLKYKELKKKKKARMKPAPLWLIIIIHTKGSNKSLFIYLFIMQY